VSSRAKDKKQETVKHLICIAVGGGGVVCSAQVMRELFCRGSSSGSYRTRSGREEYETTAAAAAAAERRAAEIEGTHGHGIAPER
jgi:hypothetical protein